MPHWMSLGRLAQRSLAAWSTRPARLAGSTGRLSPTHTEGRARCSPDLRPVHRLEAVTSWAAEDRDLTSTTRARSADALHSLGKTRLLLAPCRWTRPHERHEAGQLLDDERRRTRSSWGLLPGGLPERLPERLPGSTETVMASFEGAAPLARGLPPGRASEGPPSPGARRARAQGPRRDERLPFRRPQPRRQAGARGAHRAVDQRRPRARRAAPSQAEHLPPPRLRDRGERGWARHRLTQRDRPQRWITASKERTS